MHKLLLPMGEDTKQQHSTQEQLIKPEGTRWAALYCYTGQTSWPWLPQNNQRGHHATTTITTTKVPQEDVRNAAEAAALTATNATSAAPNGQPSTLARHQAHSTTPADVVSTPVYFLRSRFHLKTAVLLPSSATAVILRFLPFPISCLSNSILPARLDSFS